MNKTRISIGLGAGMLMLSGCANYSGYANNITTPVYYAPDTIDYYPTPPIQHPKDAAQKERWRYQIFDMPTDRSKQW